MHVWICGASPPGGKESMSCVESIRTWCKGFDYTVVIVDNASNNGSFETLEQAYQHADDIVLLRNSQNEGFARGNNVGYRYCKRHGCDYIVTINNDAVLESGNLIPCATEDYRTGEYGVIGPDIISGKTHEHQNPVTPVIDSQSCAEQLNLYLRRRLWMTRLGIFPAVKKVKDKLVDSKAPVRNMSSSQKKYKLHGACLIFTLTFIEKFDEVFDPGTFLYLEEDILCIRCMRADVLMLYDSRITVLHEGDVATNAMDKQSSRKKEITMLKRQLQSYDVLIKYFQ